MVRTEFYCWEQRVVPKKVICSIFDVFKSREETRHMPTAWHCINKSYPEWEQKILSDIRTRGNKYILPEGEERHVRILVGPFARIDEITEVLHNSQSVKWQGVNNVD